MVYDCSSSDSEVIRSQTSVDPKRSELQLESESGRLSGIGTRFALGGDNHLKGIGP